MPVLDYIVKNNSCIWKLSPKPARKDAMARPRAFDETEVLRSLEDVFWRQGYEATSYDDLMRASGLGKGSLYAAYGDKRALYLKALEGYIAHEIGPLGVILTDDRLSGPARLRALFDEVIRAVEVAGDRRGCFLCNAAVDQAAHDPDVGKMVGEALAAATGAIDVAIEACGPTKANAHGVFATFLGMRVLAKSGADIASLKAARDTALAPFQD